MITVLLLLATAAVAAYCIRAVRRRVAERDTPPELRGDWWDSFERQFRAYARTRANAAPPRHPDPSRRRSLG
ncbi:MAG TPA: hypothetical protein VE127_16720 [Solirubrobacteraceae bacterium]|jgi:hypothetical protein|nr:hypothetical protein [Solirubrobacteraceae bacterium]